MKEMPVLELEAKGRALNEVADAISKVYPGDKPTEISDRFKEAALSLLKLLEAKG